MEAPREDSAEEVARLRTCLNDLVSLMALPALRTGGEQDQIVRALLDALLGMLRLDVVWLRLNDSEGGRSGETVRVAESLHGTAGAREITQAIDLSLGETPERWPPRAQVSLGNIDLSVAFAPLRLHGEIGVAVAGSLRPDFPTQTEQLVLDVAASQAAIGLQQALLRESERNSHTLMDSIPGLVALLTAGGEVQFVNRQILEYTGRTLDELKGWGTNDTVHPEDLPDVIQTFTQAIVSGSPYEIEQRLRRSDGAYLWFQNNGFPLRDATGQIVRWCVLLTDIDERKRAEDALRESEREARQIVDSIPGLITAFGPGGDLEFVNRPVLQYFGKTLDELKRWEIGGMTHPEDLPRVTELFTRSIASGEPFEMEVRARRFDGVYRWFESRGFPLRDRNGQIVRWYNLLIDIDERKRAEEAVRARERFRVIVDDLPVMVTIMTPDGEFTEGNRHMLDYFGAPLEELKRRPTTDSFHPDDRPSVDARWKESVETGRPYDYEARLRRADGTYRWFHTRGVPLRDADGRIVLWHLLQTDVDDRKRAEEALAASERDLKLIIDSIPALAWSARPDGTADFFNQLYLDFIGLSAEAASGWGWTTAVHPEDINVLAAAWQRIMASEAPGEAEARLRRSDRDYRWFLFRANPLRDETGAIVKWYGVNTDIEDRKHAEAELRRAYDSFADAQRLSKTGSYIADLLVDDLNWSEEAYRIFEFDPGTRVTVQRVRDVIHPDDLPSFESVIARGMSGVDVNFAFRIVTARGAVKHVRGVAHVVERVEGRPLFIGALQDVTESMVAEEALNRARFELAHVARVTTLSALTASIAHEVNQPLSGIITNASTGLRMLDADPPNVEGARATVRRTIRDGNRASEVITRLRALFSKKELALELLDLNEAIREVIALSLTELQRNRVVLHVELADDLPSVTGDRVQLQQVVLNLLRNASDAMVDVRDRPRQVVIRTEPEESDQVRVTVRDAGVGLSPQSLGSLFDPFSTTKSGGMGMGLFVSRSIIDRHRGRLWAEPNDDGRGATFSFSIPRDAESVLDTAPALRTS